MNYMLMNAWLASMVVLLMCSNVIPNAFNIALTIFYAPIVGFVFYVLFSIVPRDIWYCFGLMCLFLYNM